MDKVQASSTVNYTMFVEVAHSSPYRDLLTQGLYTPWTRMSFTTTTTFKTNAVPPQDPTKDCYGLPSGVKITSARN